MARKRARRATPPVEAGAGRQAGRALVSAANARNGGALDFAFGDPEPVLERRQWIDLLECWHNDRWYEPPIPLDGLARAFRVSPHHSSAILLKVNLVVESLDPAALIDPATLRRAVQDYLVFGNAYLEPVTSRLGGVVGLRHALARYTRRGLVDGDFWWVPGTVDATPLAAGTVQLMMPDVSQELYGVPEYLSALQSALLNEAATLFRRRYYLNGSHAGFILYATGDIDPNDTEAIKAAMRASKGPGNFRNMFVHAPNGKEGSIRVLPIAEVGAKDEFLGIKNATQADVMAAHRVPPQLLGIVPAQGSAFGNPKDATAMFLQLEIAPLQAVFLDLNARLGAEVIRFRARDPAG